MNCEINKQCLLNKDGSKLELWNIKTANSKFKVWTHTGRWVSGWGLMIFKRMIYYKGKNIKWLSEKRNIKIYILIIKREDYIKSLPYSNAIS